MARKPMKKFGTGKRYADAGTVTKAPEMSLNDIRLRRKTDDIQSDYQKAQTRNAGNTAKLNVAKAKYEQRMADAKDDMAKWSGGDRTATRKGESDAEAALTQARRTRGQSIADRDTAAAKLTTAPAATATAVKPDYDKMSFAKAFAAARGVEGKPNFTWKGKSYNTNLASSKPAKPNTAAPAAKPNTAAPAAKPNTAAPAAKPNTAAKSLPPAAKSNLEEIRNKGATFRVELARPPAANKPAPDDKPTGPRKIYGEGVFRRYDNKPLGGIPEYVDTSTAASRARASAPFRAVGRGVGNTAMFAANYLNPLGLAANMLFPSEGGDDEGKRRGGAIKKKPTAKKPVKKPAKKPVMKYAKGGSIDGCAIRGKTRAKRT
jgi:hypothetical protein